MSTIKELLGQGDIPKPSRNFLQENVRRLKDLKLEKTTKNISQRNQSAQPLTERRNIQTATGGRLRSSSRPKAESRLQRSPPPRRQQARAAGVQASQVQPATPDFTPKGYRSQGCQTLNLKQLESLYHDGVIRYPSVRGISTGPHGDSDQAIVSFKEMALQTDDEPQVISLHPLPETLGRSWDEEEDCASDEIRHKDFVKMNATVPEPLRRKPSESNRSDPARAPPFYQRGIVPKYLREHKKEVERERLAKAQEAANECPEGHILLPDDVRMKHLTNLREKYAILVSQLNKLPVSTDTLRTRTRKKEIEGDLDRVEAAMVLFSREKVFVKADS